MTKLPDCPSCGSNRSVYEDGDRNYFCTSCRKAFADGPTEGGDHYNDPTKRLELQDERAKRKRLKRPGRHGRATWIPGGE